MKDIWLNEEDYEAFRVVALKLGVSVSILKEVHGCVESSNNSILFYKGLQTIIADYRNNK